MALWGQQLDTVGWHSISGHRTSKWKNDHWTGNSSLQKLVFSHRWAAFSLEQDMVSGPYATSASQLISVMLLAFLLVPHLVNLDLPRAAIHFLLIIMWVFASSMTFPNVTFRRRAHKSMVHPEYGTGHWVALLMLSDGPPCPACHLSFAEPVCQNGVPLCQTYTSEL